MVASDTVVGLVGAGILLVALVGVFVYESRQGGTNAEFGPHEFQIVSTGTAQYTAASGTMAPPPAPAGTCAPAPAACTPARTTVDLSVTGLPDAHGSAYVAFLKGTDTVVVGALQKSGEKYATGAKTINGPNRGTLIVTLEPSASATSPTGPTILTYSGIAAGAAKDLKMNMAMPLIKQTGNNTLTYTPQGGDVNVTATFGALPSYSAFTYRGWMLDESDAGMVWTFVGNFTAPAMENGTITGVVPGSQGDYDHFIVTIEPKAAWDGMMPKGPEIMLNPED